jgi:MFS family permease
MNKSRILLLVWLFCGLCGIVAGAEFVLLHTGKLDILVFLTMLMGLGMGIPISLIYVIGSDASAKEDARIGITIAIVLSVVFGWLGPIAGVIIPLVTVIVKTVRLIGYKNSD